MTDTIDESGNEVKESMILLVDDTTANIQVSRETLDGLGCKLLIAKNGLSMLEIVREAHPSLSSGKLPCRPPSRRFDACTEDIIQAIE